MRGRRVATTRVRVDALPAELRSVLLLVCVEGRSYRVATEALGAPTGAVMSPLAPRTAPTARLDIAPRKDTAAGRAVDYVRAEILKWTGGPGGTLHAPNKRKMGL